jgi:membrane-bound metal-dependent hydrolase YbcI (DUF457 family)
VDPLTHTLAGVGLAQAFFRKRLGPRAVPILALASNLPDVDVAVHFTLDPTAVLLRRTFGHSIFLLPLWAALLAWLFRRRHRDLSWRLLFGVCLLGAVVHVFFDLVNSFGVVLLWPFSDARPELAIIFIIDFILTGLLLAPLLVCAPRALRGRLPALSRLSLAAVGAYVVFCGALRFVAGRELSRELERESAAAGRLEAAVAERPPPIEFSYVFPEPLGPHRWRGVARRGGEYGVYLIRPLSGGIERRKAVRTDAGHPRVEAARATRLGRRLERFFKAPVWRLEGDSEVSVGDLRFRPLALEREAVFVYVFEVGDDGIASEIPRVGRSAESPESPPAEAR